jgi:hypothetical protein
MSVDHMQPLSDRCSKIQTPVGNCQNPTCVWDAAKRAMIENIRTHPYTRAVCLETTRLFEHRAAKHLVEAQDWADKGAADSALEFQTKARLAQQRANAWHLRAKNASN